MMTPEQARRTARSLLRLPRDRAEELLVSFILDSERSEAKRLGQGFVGGVVLAALGWCLLGWLGAA